MTNSGNGQSSNNRRTGGSSSTDGTSIEAEDAIRLSKPVETHEPSEKRLISVVPPENEVCVCEKIESNILRSGTFVHIESEFPLFLTHTTSTTSVLPMHFQSP
jgi:hypothetical protein